MSPVSEARPREREALFNPAFIALVLSRAAAGHQKRTDRAMPLSLCFITVPIALHGPTRGALPRKVTTKPGAWLDDHPLLRAGFSRRARAAAPHVRAGLREGLRAGILEIAGENIVGRPPRRRPGVALSEESEEILKRAQFAGGWLGLAGSPSGVFALWGVRP
jgi:hypothetical protein